MPECQYCGKVCKNKTALAMHENSCKKKNGGADEPSENTSGVNQTSNTGNNNETVSTSDSDSSETLTREELGLGKPEEKPQEEKGYCSECGFEVSKTATICPNCKESFE